MEVIWKVSDGTIGYNEKSIEIDEEELFEYDNEDDVREFIINCVQEDFEQTVSFDIKKESMNKVIEEWKKRPTYEPEDCEKCKEESEESGIEYNANFTWDGSSWICDNCGRPC